MASILYFASLAETLGNKSEQLELPADCNTVTELVALLRARGALSSPRSPAAKRHPFSAPRSFPRKREARIDSTL
jgi:hypothetical protein